MYKLSLNTFKFNNLIFLYLIYLSKIVLHVDNYIFFLIQIYITTYFSENYTYLLLRNLKQKIEK